MSSYADIGRQGKFHRFLISSLTTPIASIRWSHFPWGCLTEFPMVSYKILGPFVLRVHPRNNAIFFCQMLTLSSNDDNKRQVNHRFAIARFTAPEAGGCHCPWSAAKFSWPCKILGNFRSPVPYK